MEQDNDKLTLIVPVEVTQTYEMEDREGGEMHGLEEQVINAALSVGRQIDLAQARERLAESMRQVNGLLRNLKHDVIEGWELDSLSIGLAISAEGSIGVVTAGVEASIELSFNRTRPSPG